MDQQSPPFVAISTNPPTMHVAHLVAKARQTDPVSRQKKESILIIDANKTMTLCANKENNEHRGIAVRCLSAKPSGPRSLLGESIDIENGTKSTSR
jgi:hypothetical protein